MKKEKKVLVTLTSAILLAMAFLPAVGAQLEDQTKTEEDLENLTFIIGGAIIGALLGAILGALIG